ncbi:hypothetical protein Hte_005203 [Hypoxylon texense]
MCKRHDLFYMCGCRFVDEATGEWKYEVEQCEWARKRRRSCAGAKLEIALPIFSKDKYCDDPHCPAYSD